MQEQQTCLFATNLLSLYVARSLGTKQGRVCVCLYGLVWMVGVQWKEEKVVKAVAVSEANVLICVESERRWGVRMKTGGGSGGQGSAVVFFQVEWIG